jgi:single-strand DNA-binding protein
MNVNKVILVGRLTRDPELRSTQIGQNVANISIATTHSWTDKNGQKQEKPEFHNIVLWGRLAEIAGQYLIKGQECYFEGRLQTRSFVGKDGVERRATEVVAEIMQMGSKPKSAQGGYQPNTGGYQDTQNDFSHNNVPAAAPVAGSAAGSAAMSTQKKPPVEDDSIPTINLDDEKDDVRIEDVPF